MRLQEAYSAGGFEDHDSFLAGASSRESLALPLLEACLSRVVRAATLAARSSMWADTGGRAGVGIGLSTPGQCGASAAMVCSMDTSALRCYDMKRESASERERER